MKLIDLLWITAILGGAAWLFYRSFWKQKGPCSNCSGCSCPEKNSGRKQA